MTGIVELATAVSGDLAKEAIGETVRRILTRRLRDAQEILLEKVRSGDILLQDAVAEDEAVAMLYRYARAAQEGSARANLRLLACVMRGELVQPRPAAESFQRWADLLSGITTAEIRLLGELYRRCLEFEVTSKTDGPNSIKALNAVKGDLMGPRKLFETEDHLKQTLQALLRTGLIMSEMAWDGMIYWSSPLMHQLVEQIGFEEFANDAGRA